MERTNHFNNDRQQREKFIEEIIGQNGNVVASFLVDKGHWNGKEIHTVLDNGIIEITNQRTGKLVTKLIARVGQLNRYLEGWNGQVEKTFNANGEEVSSVVFPRYLWRKAASNARKGYNMR